jgi:hypothetical protein
MRRVILVLSLTFLGLLTFAGSVCHADVSRSAVLFLRIAAGARAAGMGEAFVAVANDATATHWNPAGLGSYPLTSTWLEHPLPASLELRSMALLRNDIPELNYMRYDIWVIGQSDLYRMHRGEWLNYQDYPTSAGESVESILRKFFQVQDEARLKNMKETTAQFNQPVSRDSLVALRDRLVQTAGEKGERLSAAWDDMLAAWDECKLSGKNLGELLGRVQEFLPDSALSAEQVDRLSSLVDATVIRSLPDVLKIPYGMLFEGKLTSIGSEGKVLWVGTEKGLFSFDGKKWGEYGAKDGLPSDHITAILAISTRSVWVGTDQGPARFDGAKWAGVPLPGDAADRQVVAFANRGEREMWTATTTNLYKLKGESWQPYEEYSVLIGDSLEKVVRGFLGTQNVKTISRAVQTVKAYNALADSGIAAGQTLNLPFELAIPGRITALVVDGQGSLWMGTDHGLKRFTEGKWFTYGYRVYTAQEGDDVQMVARKFLQSDDQQKISKLSQMIIDYNQLDSTGKLDPGEKIHVYYNATGSRILSLVRAGGSSLFVGTEYGTVKWDGEGWSRYYHAGLERDKAETMIHQDGEMWFGTPDKVVIYAHAKREITFMHANWLPELASDLYYEYFSYVQHVEGWGTVGGNVTFLSLGQNVRTDEFSNVLGTFDSYELAVTFSYGTRLNSSLAGGLSAKIIYSHLADQGAGLEKGKGSGSSFALDAGFLYQTPIKRLTLGSALTNLGPNISYIDLNQSDPLPRNLAVGLAYKLVDTPFNRLTGTFEVNKELVGLDDSFSQEWRETILNMGMEYWYGTYVALRGGYVYDRVGDVKNPTFGVGLQYGLFRFDFAYIPSSKTSALSNTMRFSMTGRF